ERVPQGVAAELVEQLPRVIHGGEPTLRSRCCAPGTSRPSVVGAPALACSGARAGGRPMDELQWVPAWELRERMVARELSPVEVMEALLARVDRLGPVLNPFITVVADQALDGARRAEQAIMDGDPLGPLHGVPVSGKDVLWTKGIRTTMGSKLFEDFVPDRDATFAARLRSAGAIIFAKANTPEFSMYRRSLNLVSRECLTPWDPALERSSGGSSGGSG